MSEFRPERLQRLRLEQGDSLRDAATKTGSTKETVSELERGVRKPHPSTLRKLAEGYGVPVSYFLEEDPQPPKAEDASLKELLEEWESETSLLAMPDEEWHTAYAAPSWEEAQQKAIELGRKAHAEYWLIRPALMAEIRVERELDPDTPLRRLPSHRLHSIALRRFLKAYNAARDALAETDDPTDGGRFPAPKKPEDPSLHLEDPEEQPRFVQWDIEQDETPELITASLVLEK